MKKVILILVLFLMAILASETIAQAPSSESPTEFTNPWVEALRYANECVAITQNGYDCECVNVVRKMVKGGEITKVKGDLLIILGCKKAPKPAPGTQGVKTYECINGHV
jgi:hypothetical protein